jgi:hypothetical protein
MSAYQGAHQKKKRRKSVEEFCKRLGIKHNTRQGSVEWGWNGPNYQGAHKKKKRRENTDAFCQRHGIKQENRQGQGVEFLVHRGGTSQQRATDTNPHNR